MISGVIFDMDGLMFDTEPVWKSAWAPALAAYGLEGLPGLADAAGAALDAMRLPDMLGCISGNDSVAVIARNEQDASRLCGELRRYCK